MISTLRFATLPAILFASAAPLSAIAATDTTAGPRSTENANGLPSGYLRSGTTWNLELEGGSLSTNVGRLADFRVQVGALVVREPQFYSVGVFGEHAFGLGSACGLITSYTNLATGIWTQVGGLRDENARNGFLLSTGWSLFGIEGQRRFASESLAQTDWLVEIKLRIPIGIIAALL